MNLRWNANLHRFEAELGSGGFKADLAAVQAAKFKCDGPPTWVWHSNKALLLKYLREHRPPVLTITPEARAEYERLLPIEENNAKVKEALVEAKKVVKKQKAKVQRQAELVTIEIPTKGYIDAEDLPPFTPLPNKYVPPPPPDEKCMICECPVYWYEYLENGPKVCLWCQKNVLDIPDEI